MTAFILQIAESCPKIGQLTIWCPNMLQSHIILPSLRLPRDLAFLSRPLAPGRGGTKSSVHRKPWKHGWPIWGYYRFSAWPLWLLYVGFQTADFSRLRFAKGTAGMVPDKRPICWKWVWEPILSGYLWFQMAGIPYWDRNLTDGAGAQYGTGCRLLIFYALWTGCQLFSFGKPHQIGNKEKRVFLVSLIRIPPFFRFFIVDFLAALLLSSAYNKTRADNPWKSHEITGSASMRLALSLSLFSSPLRQWCFPFCT